jgi:hypothetical protein
VARFGENLRCCLSKSEYVNYKSPSVTAEEYVNNMERVSQHVGDIYTLDRWLM